MLAAFALAFALFAAQPAAAQSATASPAKPSSPAISEATPVAVPPATPEALRYYTSGNWLWVLDQVVGIVLLAVILFSGASARLRTWAQLIGRKWFFTIAAGSCAAAGTAPRGTARRRRT